MARPNKLYVGEANHSYRPALERFAEKCVFDATTGCVLWTGGTTAGRGNSARYGSFWFEGQRWFAHRWAAVHIHGIALGEHQAGHCCPHGPNTLCVEHLTGQTILENLDELNNRLKAKRASQSNSDRQHWLFVSIGITQLPEDEEPEPDAVPFYEPPAWFKPFMKTAENENDCPF
jgi:hypothetical protein